MTDKRLAELWGNGVANTIRFYPEHAAREEEGEYHELLDAWDRTSYQEARVAGHYGNRVLGPPVTTVEDIEQQFSPLGHALDALREQR